MTVEHPTKAFSRFCLEVIFLCLGLKRILAWSPAESVRHKWMVILYLRSFSALKLVCRWLCSETDSGGSKGEWACENKKGVNRILCIWELILQSGTREGGIQIAKKDIGSSFRAIPHPPP